MYRVHYSDIIAINRIKTACIESFSVIITINSIDTECIESYSDTSVEAL